jgi:hypothetical protein
MADLIDPSVRAGAVVIVTGKRDALVAERSELLERRADILSRLRGVEREMADCRAAVRLFQLDIEFPPEEQRWSTLLPPDPSVIRLLSPQRDVAQTNPPREHLDPKAGRPPPPSQISKDVPHQSVSIDPSVRAGAAAIVSDKRDALVIARSELLEQRADILSRLRRVESEIADCRATARLFQLDIEFPPDEQEAQAAAPEAADRQAKQLIERVDPLQERPTARRQTLRDILLEQLKLAGETGSKAAPLREFFERTTGQIIHEKTVGMTLYRLLKDGLVHRTGHTWFFGPPPAAAGVEMENPGASSPAPNQEKV